MTGMGQREPSGWTLGVLVALVVSVAVARRVDGATLTAKNGMTLQGQIGYIAKLSKGSLIQRAGQEENLDVNQIVLLDDGLRRMYLSHFQIQEDSLRESNSTPQEIIRIRQNVASGRQRIASVSAILRIGSFDTFGRRSFEILTPRGPVEVTQGITEITPIYTKLEGLDGVSAVKWDCRIATSSLSRDTIEQVMRSHASQAGPELWLQLVRLYLASERYNDARMTLEAAMQEFPELQEFQQLLVELRSLTARRLIDEIELRQAAGQFQRSFRLLQQFPAEGVGGEVLPRVNELLRAHEMSVQRSDAVRQQLRDLKAVVRDAASVALIDEIEGELATSLNSHTLERLADYERLRDDPQLTDAGRLALLISGWLGGAGQATQNVTEAISLIRVRRLIREYLNEVRPEARAPLLRQLGQEEGATPQRVLSVLSLMAPPVATPPQEGRPQGSFVLQTKGLRSDETYEYEIQLPEEYDPLRRYPVIVTLHGEGYAPRDQIDWWCGAAEATRPMRVGQAGRQGYIVLAPRWMGEAQERYGYSGDEHARVLLCLRDAMRRFSFDLDRVFLSGHSAGGDAAWDLGLAHPDLWAGVIPIVAAAKQGPDSPQYVARYEANVGYTGWYFLMGELDGTKLELNAADFDRYLTRPRRDVTLVEFQGRGHEHFYDEIHRLFEWMKLHRRNAQITEFETVTMRTFDNFFWYLEFSELPSRALVDPLSWPAPPTARPAVIEFRAQAANNHVHVRTPAAQTRLWLPPGLIDETQRVTIHVNGRAKTYQLLPQVETILEDVRSRGDRQHPFWIVVDLPTGKRAE